MQQLNPSGVELFNIPVTEVTPNEVIHLRGFPKPVMIYVITGLSHHLMIAGENRLTPAPPYWLTQLLWV